ncbi:MAG: SgcJ/EcaC family oxidoreductase [Chloroflexi bacterium]|nr:SgcJ/EcaC family oxidoreductase [Chloroflexota bacterium]
MQSQSTSSNTSSDEAAIRDLYHQLMAGWNRGSGQEFAAPFTETADFVAFDGSRFKGRQEIARSHQPLFDTHLKGTQLVGDVTSVRWLSPDVALIHAVGGTVMRGKSAPTAERDSIQTLVAIKSGGEWHLDAFQNTRVRPIGRSTAGTLLWLGFDWLWKLLHHMPAGSLRSAAKHGA